MAEARERVSGRRARREPWDMRPPRRLPGARKTGFTVGRVLAAAGLTVAGLLAARAVLDRRPPRRRAPRLPTPAVAEARAQASRRAMESAAVLAGSVLLDSAMEHFRGNYHNRAMYVAPAVSAATVAAAIGGRARARAGAPPSRAGEVVFGLAALTGIAGLGFHVYNIAERPGGLTRLNNLFYASPILSPGGSLVAGAMGLIAGRTHRQSALSALAEGRLVALVSAGSLIATTAEVALLHFRGAFQDRAMFVPLIVPPAAAGALTAAAVWPEDRLIRLARDGCRLSLAVGAAGVGFHIYGVHRNHGGWRNWRQNMVQGPPVFAPPAYTGLGLSGLGALDLIERARR